MKKLPTLGTVVVLVLWLWLAYTDWGSNMLGMLGLVAPYNTWQLFTLPGNIVGISVRSGLSLFGVLLAVWSGLWLVSLVRRYEDQSGIPDQVHDVVGEDPSVSRRAAGPQDGMGFAPSPPPGYTMGYPPGGYPGSGPF